MGCGYHEFCLSILLSDFEDLDFINIAHNYARWENHYKKNLDFEINLENFEFNLIKETKENLSIRILKFMNKI